MQFIVALLLALLAIAIGRVYTRGRRVMIARELVATHTSEDIAKLRAMALAHPKSCRFYLAVGLNNLATRQGLMGQHADGLLSTLEATAIMRELWQGNPNLEGYLAQFLANLSAKHHLVGERELALAAARESVEIRRKMAQANSDASEHPEGCDFLPDLAFSLQNLSAAQEGEEALASSTEAVRVIRPLVEKNPSVLLPILAGSLGNLGTAQFALNQLSESVVTTSEAVAIRRQLAATDPAAMRPLLAGLLSTLGAAQSELGEHEQSVASLSEALQILRGLVKEQPDAQLPVLAGCLLNLAATYRKQGRRTDALAPAREAVSLFGSLAEKYPLAHAALLREAVALLRGLLQEPS